MTTIFYNYPRRGSKGERREDFLLGGDPTARGRRSNGRAVSLQGMGAFKRLMIGGRLSKDAKWIKDVSSWPEEGTGTVTNAKSRPGNNSYIRGKNPSLPDKKKKG